MTVKITFKENGKTKNILLEQFKGKNMVSHTEIYPLVRMIWNLATIHMEAVIAMAPLSKIPIKGKSGILDPLEAFHLGIVVLTKYHEELADLPSEIKLWIDLFEKEYGDPSSTVFMKNIHLKIEHAKKLEAAAVRWFEKIYKIYEKPNTKLLNQNEFAKSAQELSKKLDKMETLDLHDGYECLMNNIPTPGVMILYRVGESMVRKFYVKEMGHESPEGSTMGSMAKELREKQVEEIAQKKRTKPDPLVNYILHQTEERNLAQHTERRFDQTEAEEVFIFVKKLINDIHERLQK